MGSRVREYEGIEVGRFEGEAVGFEVGTNVGQEEVVIGALEGNPLGKAESKTDGTEEG